MSGFDVDRLDVGIGPLALVRAVRLSLRAGMLHALVGESGSGKSLTARALVGLEPEGATVTRVLRFGGQTVTNPVRLRGAQVVYMPQEPLAAIHPVLRLGAQLVEAGAADPVKALAEVGLSDPARLLRRVASELSGGMRQRALLALSLAPNPKVLLVDEPTTALDASATAHVLTLLRRLTMERHLAVLLITHDLGLAQRADEVTVMYAGAVVETGPASRVLHSPKHPYTRALLQARPALEPGAVGQVLPGSVPTVTVGHVGCTFAPRCWRATARCVAQTPALVDDAACHHPLGVA